MISPLTIILDPISLAIFAMYGGLMIWEALAPGRELPFNPKWIARGLLSFVLYFFLSSYLPMLWTETLTKYQVFDLTGLGLWGAVVGVVLFEFGVYFWHRGMHSFKWLWAIHRMHHSPKRLDTFGAFYFNPLDMVILTALSSLCLTLIIGLTAQATTVVLLLTTFFAIFQHANIKTPSWIGYLVQRPESHTVHHAEGIHQFNYSDLPVIDLAFGTFRNPKGFEHKVGLG